MIVCPEADHLWVMTQADHAFFAGELLALWRAENFDRHPRRPEILFAAREHDNGWREADAAPRVDPTTGRPHTFLSIPLGVREEIWSLAVERFRAAHPYASLLIAHHALNVHHDHRDQDDWLEFFRILEQQRDELQELCEVPFEALAEDYPYLEITDQISLALCSGWEGKFEKSGFSWSVTGDTVSLEPFPLAGATSFELRGRRIPDRGYSNMTDLGGQLAEARWEKRRVRVKGL